MTLYRFVDEQKADGFSVQRICDVAGVSTSAYYDWKQHRDRIGAPTGGLEPPTSFASGAGR